VCSSDLNQSYQNIVIAYDCATVDRNAVQSLKHHLAQQRGYQLLTDSYSIYQRLVHCSTAISIDEPVSNHVFKFTIEFDCKPQKWFDRGSTIMRSANGNFDLVAPGGALESTPYIEISGSGAVSLFVDGQGTQSLGVLSVVSGKPSMVIDCEAKVAFKNNNDGTRSAFNLAWFPKPTTANAQAGFSGTVSNIKWQGRWWTI
jgi:phage-related protein